MCNTRISQFYLSPTHEPYLPLLPSRKASLPFGWYSLRLTTKQWKRWVDLTGWPHTEINVPHQELNPDMVTHPSTNRAQRLLTSLKPMLQLLHWCTTHYTGSAIHSEWHTNYPCSHTSVCKGKRRCTWPDSVCRLLLSSSFFSILRHTSRKPQAQKLSNSCIHQCVFERDHIPLLSLLLHRKQKLQVVTGPPCTTTRCEIDVTFVHQQSSTSSTSQYAL